MFSTRKYKAFPEHVEGAYETNFHHGLVLNYF